MLSKDQILSASDLPCETVPVPEWGGSVIVRTMRGCERDAFEQGIITDKKANEDRLVNVRAKLAALTVCDDKGELLFTEADVTALGKKSGKALDRIFDVAQRLCGIGEKDVAALEGN